MAIRLTLGRKGYGKTTLSYYMARRVSPRLLVFDPRGLVRRPGATIARTRESVSSAIDALAGDDTTEVVYAPSEHFKSIAFPHFAAEVNRWVYEHREKALSVLIDEISFVNMGDEDFDQALKACDEHTHHFFLTCHRPADAPVDVRALADFWYIFAVHQEHDLDVIAERCSPAAADAARHLTGRALIGWNHKDGVIRYDNPQSWYVDLHPDVMLVPPVELDSHLVL